LMIGNKEFLSRYLKFKLPDVFIDDPTHNQLTFLVRSFFFVFVGLLATFGKIEFILIGIIAAIILYLIRIPIVRLSLRKKFTVLEKKITVSMIPRGLAAAVMATIPLTMGLQNAEYYPQIVFVIILGSVIITTVALTKSKSHIPKNSDAIDLKK